MHRILTLILLVCAFVNSLAADEPIGDLPESQCRQHSYRDSLYGAVGGWRNHVFQQCFFDSIPIIRARVSAEELIVREIPSPPEDKKAMTGICFSGGGSRSLSLARGQLAALFYLGYESKINYISMISGGAWGAANFYALSDDVRKNYLGNVVEDLSSLYWGEKRHKDDRNIAWLHPYSLGQVPQRLGLSGAAWHFVSNFYSQGTKIWSEYLNNALLAPYGLNAEQVLKESLFPAKPAHMQLIVSAGVKNASGELVPLEITPVGIGARVPVDNAGHAYVLPPEGFGREALGIKSGYLWVAGGRGFTLGDMHAVTSSNYVHKMPVFWDAMSALGMLVPRFNWLNVNFTSGVIEQHQHQVVDSGLDEYLGLMPLLARGMRKVVAFVNTDIPIIKEEMVVGLEKALPSYFGIMLDKSGVGERYRLTASDAEGGCGRFCLRNQVFPSSYYHDLADHLWQAKQDGKPVVYLQKNLPILDNDKYGIKGGGLVDILWVYNDLPKDWFKRLNDTLQKNIAESDEFLCASSTCQPHGYRFPHYNTMTELKLSREQVNMLFHLPVWFLLNSREEFEELFDAF